MAEESKRTSKEHNKPCPDANGIVLKEGPILSHKLAASIDRLSKPKFTKAPVSRRTGTHKSDPKSPRGATEMHNLSSEKLGKPLTSKEQIDQSEEFIHSTSKTGRTAISNQSMTDIAQLQDNSTASFVAPKKSTNLSRNLASSVERLSRPKSRKTSLQQNRLSLNLDEQRQFLEEVLEAGLPDEHKLLTPSSSVESVCSMNSKSDFGSKSSITGNAASFKRFRKHSRLSCHEKRSTKDVSVTEERKKARSERMLASMDNLSSSMQTRHSAAAKPASPKGEDPDKLSARKRAISMDRVSNVGSRLTSPTFSSTMKFRVGSDMKLNVERSPSNTSLSSTGKAKNKIGGTGRRYKSTLSENRKESDDVVGKRIKSLAETQRRTQKNAFTRWMNAYLEQHDSKMTILDLFEDLKDGVKLIKLLEILSGEKLPVEKGKRKVNHLCNIDTVLKHLESKKIRLINIHKEGIYEGNPSMVLALIWSIILNYQVKLSCNLVQLPNGNKQKTVPLKQKFLALCQETICKVTGGEKIIKDFGKSLKDGQAIKLLIHAFRPDLVDFVHAVSQDKKKNLANAFLIAEKRLGVPNIIEPKDLNSENPDERSIMAYIALMTE